ncbi:BMC domain-containing protein [Rubrivirga sp. IMCC45206]|uniref:BMC domain-containing protein n=1 Tax=Rubrivirga sp. IMCC45206 TaxID=3391614 RepID=UPI00399003A6
MADPSPYEALGLLETHGLVAAIEAADAMVKAAGVRLVRQERTNPALITHLVVGDVAAVRSALDAGRAAGERVGTVVSAHLIPRPAPGVWTMLVGAEPGALPSVRKPAASAGDDLGDRTVKELRQLARDRDDDRLSGRDISRASKDELLAFLRATS